MKKMLLPVWIVIGLCLMLIPFSTISVASEPLKTKTLKLAAGGYAENSFFGKQFKWWADEVEKRSGGKVKVQIFWIESLVKSKDMLPAIQSDFTDVGRMICIYFPSNFPLFTLLDHANNCYKDYGSVVLAGIETMEKEPTLKAELEKQKVVMVAPYTSGQTIIGTKTCLNSIADLKGKTVRTAGGIRAQHLKNLGANPVFLPSTDAYEGLDRGTISAVGDFPASLILSYKIYEVAKCFYMSNQGVAVAAGLFMNLDVFKSFPKDIQEMFMKLRADYADMLARDLMKFEDDFIKELETKHGCKFVHPSPEDQKIIWEAGEKANEDLIKTQEAGGHKSARAVVNYYTNALKRYEAERAKKK